MTYLNLNLIVNMSQIHDKLIFIFTTLTKNIPLASSQLELLLDQLPKRPITMKYHAILRLLHLHQVIHTKQIDRNQSMQYDHIQLLGNILKSISGCLKINSPLKYLTLSQFEIFEECCLESKEEDLHQLGHKAYGIFPQVRSDEDQYSSIFYSSEQSQSGYIGNPNWVLSRSVFSTWYVQRKHKMKEQIQQICQFLLSTDELLNNHAKDPFKHLWYTLYCYYNQLYLNSHLLKSNDPLVTWKNQNSAFYFDILESLIGEMLHHEKVLYYLIAALINKNKHFDQHFTFSFSLFEAAFTAFQTNFEDSFQQQHLLVIIFFELIANYSNEVRISQICHLKIKQTLISHKQILNVLPFMEFFLTTQQFIQICEKHNLQIWSLPINEALQKNISNYYLNRNIVNEHTLKYLSNQEFQKHIFSTNLLGEASYALNLLKLYDTCRASMLQRLKYITQQKEEYLVNQNFDRFVEVWSNYYHLSESSSLEKAEKVLKMSKKKFNKRFRDIFYLPRDDPKIVFLTLMSYTKAVREQVNSINLTEGFGLKIKQFQNDFLPQFLSMITEENRDEFWKEWAHVLKKDKQFVDDICQY